MNQIKEQWEESQLLTNQAIDVFFLCFHDFLKGKTINTIIKNSCVAIVESIVINDSIIEESGIEGFQIETGVISMEKPSLKLIRQELGEALKSLTGDELDRESLKIWKERGSIFRSEDRTLIAIFPILEYPEKEDKFSKNKQQNNMNPKHKIWIHVSHSFVLNDYFVENHSTVRHIQPIIKGFWSKEIRDYESLCFFLTGLYDMYESQKENDTISKMKTYSTEELPIKETGITKLDQENIIPKIIE